MTVGVPGNVPYVITVGAFSDNRTPEDFADDSIPPFSSRGPTLEAFVKPDLIAPGTHVIGLLRHQSYLGELFADNTTILRYVERKRALRERLKQKAPR